MGELRIGSLPIYVDNSFDETNEEEDSYYIGEIKVTEVETLFPVNIQTGRDQNEIEFGIGYGMCYGQNETKAIAMSIMDHCLETGDLESPIHKEEFVLLHIDSVESTGFISHLKLPHYVTFQSKLDSVRKFIEQRGGIFLCRKKDDNKEFCSKLLVAAFRSPLIWEEALEHFPQCIKFRFDSRRTY